jgi:hypothetical protein
MLDLFGGSSRMLLSNLLENGTLTRSDLRTLQNAVPGRKKNPAAGKQADMPDE